MEQPQFKWCREAIEQVRFKPDRDKIWDELIAHIEDRTEDMKSRGYTQEEAETRAVTAMGNPEEVGKQLNAVHKPWLGRLWIVSKVLVILTLIVSLFFVYPAVNKYRNEVMDDAKEQNTLDYWVQNCSPISRYAVDKTMEIDGYRFTVDEVSWWGEEEHVRLAICVTIRSPLFQPKPEQYGPDNVGARAFYIVDDQGVRDVEWDDEDPYLPRRRGCYYDASKVGRPLTGSCIFVYDAYYWNPDWVELSFDFEGRTYSVRFPGPGGEGA